MILRRLYEKNYYSKEEKVITNLNFSSNDNLLIVTDNLANYYALNIFTGEKKWNHKSIFISEIKIDKDKFYVVDSNNKLNCFL